MNKPKTAKKIKHQRQNRTHSQRLQRKEELLKAIERTDFQINEGNRKEIIGSLASMSAILDNCRQRLNRLGDYPLSEADRFLLKQVYTFFVELEKQYLDKVGE